MYANGSTTLVLTHDVCTSDAQCMNGGKCIIQSDQHSTFNHCHCPEGYTGDRCENYCPLKCENDGICHQLTTKNEQDVHSLGLSSDFVCKCKGYFTGTLCEIPYTNCANGFRCMYGGTCNHNDKVLSPANACDCPLGTTGNQCEQLVLGVERSNKPSSKQGSHRKVVRTFVFALLGLFVLGVVMITLVGTWQKRHRQRKRRHILERHFPKDSQTFDMDKDISIQLQERDEHAAKWRNIV